MEKTPIIINLNENKNGPLFEGWLKAFGTNIQTILRAMFDGSSVPVNIRGSKGDVEAFVQALQSERNYLDAYRKYGLENPMTYKNKFQLNKAIAQFERTTNLIWPFNE